MDKEDIYEKYGSVELKFFDYYKYMFKFTGETPDGETVSATIGGISDDIYRIDVAANDTYTIKNLDPNFINITKNHKVIAEWNEYNHEHTTSD